MQISFAIVPFRPAALACWVMREARMETLECGRCEGEAEAKPVCPGPACRQAPANPRHGPDGGRRAQHLLTNKPGVEVTRLQRVCGQPCLRPSCDCLQRGRSNRGHCTEKLRDENEPNVAQLPRELRGTTAVFPSLRAHEPLSCRARDPSGPGRLSPLPDRMNLRGKRGKCLKPDLLRAGLFRRGRKETNF